MNIATNIETTDEYEGNCENAILAIMTVIMISNNIYSMLIMMNRYMICH